jgi:hypothetical protein
MPNHGSFAIHNNALNNTVGNLEQYSSTTPSKVEDETLSKVDDKSQKEVHSTTLLETIYHLITVIRDVLMTVFLMDLLISYNFFSHLYKYKSANEKTKNIDKLIKEQKASISSIESSFTKKPIDIVQIPATKQLGKKTIVIHSLPKLYTNHGAKHYQYLLDAGMDVVLFDFTKAQTDVALEDLKQVIEEVKTKNPDASIVLYGFSMGGHIAMGALADSNISNKIDGAICDRGLVDIYEIFSHYNWFVRLLGYLFSDYIHKYYNAGNAEKLKDFTKPMLFLSPEQGTDILMHGPNNSNLTLKAKEGRNNQFDHYYVLQKQNPSYKAHWLPLKPIDEKQVLDFIQDTVNTQTV